MKIIATFEKSNAGPGGEYSEGYSELPYDVENNLKDKDIKKLLILEAVNLCNNNFTYRYLYFREYIEPTFKKL